MITYKVKYKQKGSFFWKTIRKIKGDGVVNENKVARYFIRENEERIEIPCHDTIFKFSKERWMLISQRMNAEAGQAISIDKR
jgi:hypothetical protein